jgi:predicted transcriptional regulator
MELQEATAEKQKAIIKTVTLYKHHIDLIERVAEREHRTFSNALQEILEFYIAQNLAREE